MILKIKKGGDYDVSILFVYSDDEIIEQNLKFQIQGKIEIEKTVDIVKPEKNEKIIPIKKEKKVEVSAIVTEEI